MSFGVPMHAAHAALLSLMVACCCSVTVVPCSYDGLRITSPTFRPSVCVNCTCDTTIGRLTCEYEHCEQKQGRCSSRETTCCPTRCMPGCRLNGKFYERESQVPSADPCQRCTCRVLDNHNTSVECISKQTCNSCSPRESECCADCKKATTLSPR